MELDKSTCLDFNLVAKASNITDREQLATAVLGSAMVINDVYMKEQEVLELSHTLDTGEGYRMEMIVKKVYDNE